MLSQTWASRQKNPYIPKHDADVIRLSIEFIKKEALSILMLGAIWFLVFLIALLPIRLLYITILWSYFAKILASTPDKISLTSFPLFLIISFIVIWLLLYFLYFIYQTSLFYLIKWFTHKDSATTPWQSTKKAFSKVPHLATIYFWRIIYTILIPFLPYITGILLSLSWVSPAISLPLILIWVPLATVYVIYIIVKTSFIVIYPVEKERWDWNAFFEALDFVKGYWFYVFSILVVLWIISALLINILSNVADFIFNQIENILLLTLIVKIIVGILTFYIWVFFHTWKYFLFKRLEQIKTEKK